MLGVLNCMRGKGEVLEVWMGGGPEGREQRLDCTSMSLLSCFSLSTGPGAGQEVQTENVTVAEGGVAEITCRLHQYDGSIVVIQNPACRPSSMVPVACWGPEPESWKRRGLGLTEDRAETLVS